MPDYSTVASEEYHHERKHLFREEAKYSLWAIGTLALLMSGSLVVYGAFGGRGWLAVGILMGFFWLAAITNDCFRRANYLAGQMDYRLRIIEAEVNAIWHDVDQRVHRERELRNTGF